WSGTTAATDEVGRLRLVTPEEAPAPTATPATTPASPPTASSPTPAATADQSPGATAPDRRLEVTDPGLASVQQSATPADQAAPPTEAPAEPVAELPAQETPAEEMAPAAAAPAAAPAQETSPSLLSRLGDFWWVFVVLGLLVVA